MPQPLICSANLGAPAGQHVTRITVPVQLGARTAATSIRRSAVTISFLMLSLFLFMTPRPVHAQDERRTRMPVIGKIAGGSTRQAFSGKVQTLDLKRMLLAVQTVEGGATEFFPIKRDVTVASATGERLRLKELSPGTNVIVYYEVKEDRRSVSQIMVLGLVGDDKETGTKTKKKSEPPS